MIDRTSACEKVHTVLNGTSSARVTSVGDGHGKGVGEQERVASMAGSRGLLLKVIVLLMMLSTSAFCADINVLIIGSEHDSGDNYRVGGNSEAFSAAGIKTQLENILGGAGLGSVKVEYEDRYSYSSGYYAYNLASWFHWPYPANVETTTRWPNLRGEGGTDWDYVILIGDPYTIEYMPGLYTYGVAKVGEEVAKGGGETILLMPWPAAGSSSTVAHYKEVVYRTGRSGGFKVAPAALSWEAAGSPSGGGGHPNNDGSYIAAASVYSRIWNQSAANSTYSYNDTLADTVYNTVSANIGAVQYTGTFNFQNPFKAFGDKSRNVRPRKTGGGSSTEDFFVGATQDAVIITGASPGSGTSYWIGRDSGSPTTTKDYRLGGYDKDTFGYRYQTNTSTKDIHLAQIFYHDIDLADQMIPESDRFRALPRRLIWASIHQVDPLVSPMGTHGHLSANAIEGCASYMYTMISGRTPVESKPNPVTTTWIAHMAGYETAWRLMTCQSRAPGFKAKPTSTTVGKTFPAIATVEFLLPPKANVQVAITSSNPDVTITPQTLTFTPGNHDVQQQVSLLATSSAVAGASFNVDFSTTSDDEVYDGLSDRWSYKINTPPVANAQSIQAYSEEATPITLTGSDADGEALTYRIVGQPSNGTVDLSGAVASYVSSSGYTGPDSFTFRASDGSDESATTTVDIDVIPTSLYDYNLLKDGSAEYSPFTDHHWVEGQGTWGQSASTTDGSYAFKNTNSVKTAELYQDVDVNLFAERITRGDQAFKISGYGFSSNDEVSVVVTFRNAAGQVLSTYDSGKIGTGSWTFFEATRTAPTNTAGIRVLLRSIKKAGSNSGAFDGMSLVALEPPNVAPVAEDQSHIVATAGVGHNITLTASDIDGDDLTYSIESMPAKGTLSGTDSNVVYTPNAGYEGADSFTFKANDGELDSNIATVTIDVVSNQSPAIVLDSPTVTEVAMPFNVGLLLETTVTDDGKPNPMTLTWSRISGPAAVTFTAPHKADTGARFTSKGTYVLRLTANDGELTTTQDITVHFGYYQGYPNIASHVETGLDYSGTPGTEIVLDEASRNDDGLPNPPGAVTGLWQQLSGPGTISITDPSDVNTSVVCPKAGTYVLRLIADDGEVKTFNDVNVVASGTPNTAPVADDQSVVVDEDSSDNAITLTASDADGDTLSYTVVAQPGNGTLSGTAPNLTYTPTSGYFGSDSFTFKANDGTADSNTATVSITVDEVVPPNTAPVIVSSPWTDANPIVLPNTTNANVVATDADGDVLTYTWSKKSGPGTVTFTPNGTDQSSTATASFGAAGSYTLRVKVSDGTDTVKGTVTVQVQQAPTNTAPVADAQSVPVDEDTAKAITLTASDVDGDLLTYTVITQPANGVLSGTAPNLTYTPNPGFIGSDSFTFKANDGTVDSNIATISITVNKVVPPNAVPVANDQVLSVKWGRELNVTLTGSDADGDALSFIIVSNPANGTLTGTAPNVSYTSSPGFKGLDSFTFKANDGSDDSNVATISIEVTNVKPRGSVNSLSTTEDSAKAFVLHGEDDDGDALTYTVTSGPAHGTLSGTAPNLTYTPAAGYTGSDSMTYVVNDGLEDSDPVTVDLTVNSDGGGGGGGGGGGCQMDPAAGSALLPILLMLSVVGFTRRRRSDG